MPDFTSFYQAYGQCKFILVYSFTLHTLPPKFRAFRQSLILQLQGFALAQYSKMGEIRDDAVFFFSSGDDSDSAFCGV